MPLHRPLIATTVGVLALAACTKTDNAGPTAVRTPPVPASFALSTGPAAVVNVSDNTTAQPETPLAVNPRNSQNLITGNNDWNYNGGCGVNASFDGGRSWTKTPNGFL